MKKIKRTGRFLKKILKKENPLIISQPAEAWNKQFAAGVWDRLVTKPQPNIWVIAALCAEYAAGRQISILDIGCGNGALLAAFDVLKVKYDYSGIDFSSEAVEKLKKSYPAADARVADATFPPRFEKKFDIIVFAEMLYYIDLKCALPSYFSLLKPDGKVIVSSYRSWRSFFLLRAAKKFIRPSYSYKIIEEKTPRRWNVIVGRFNQG